MVQAAFLCNQSQSMERVWRDAQRQRLAKLCSLHQETLTSAHLDNPRCELDSLDVLFSTWGMPALTDAQLDRMPNLRAVFYAAGSVKGFASPLLERGIAVISAWGANAVPVAEFTLGQILLANKGYFRNIADCATPEGRRNAFAGNGNYGGSVSLLGAGMIGRALIELLRPFHLRILVFDPFLSAEEAQRLGVRQVDLPEAFSQGMVVSNHLANVAETCGLITGTLFKRMAKNAVFINTGRGATVCEGEMCDVLRQRPDLTALLDVTHPEPPLAESPLYSLPNILLSSHIAGSIGDEVVRMAETMIEEFSRWHAGKPVRYAVTPEMLSTMA